MDKYKKYSDLACSPSNKSKHFVLVHGVGHGAWCWYKLQRLFEAGGHKVTSIDLASAGIDPSDPNSILTFEDYNKPLVDFMAALPQHQKVILIGHSAGGLSLTHAMHEFGDKIATAIFIAATMLPSGFSSQEDIKDGTPDLSKFGDVYEFKYGLGTDKPPTSIALRKEFQRMILYQRSPQEDSTLASMLLRPWPVAISAAKFEGKEEKLDQMRRIYIKTTLDQMVKLEQQEAMIKRWPPSEVLVMQTDHSPFFSAASQLSNLILKASASACTA